MCINCLSGPESTEYILRPDKKRADDKLWHLIRQWEAIGNMFNDGLRAKERLLKLNNKNKENTI